MRIAILVLSLPLALASCHRDQPRHFKEIPDGGVHPTIIRPVEKLESIETGQVNHRGETIRVACATCHDSNNRHPVDVGTAATKVEDLKQFHLGMQFSHGNLACQSCHQAGDPLNLHLATGEKLPMTDAIQLCSQCHGPQRTSYNHGAHGGKNGHFDPRFGPVERNKCVDCHDPHGPQIPKVLPVLPPRDRGRAVPHHESGEIH